MTTNSLIGSIILFMLVVVGINGFFGAFWTLPSIFLTEAAAAVGIAVINSVGNLGGFVGPYAIGYLKDATGSMSSGLYFLAASVVLAGILVLLIRREDAKTVVHSGNESARS